jgi:insulysin
MSWPLPPDLLISGPQLVQDWGVDNNTGDEETTIYQYLDSFRISEGRVVLMAKGDEHDKIQPGLQWRKEPWYDTDYHVERFNQTFVDQVCGRSND